MMGTCEECGATARLEYFAPSGGVVCSMACVERQLTRWRIERLRGCIEELLGIVRSVPGALAASATERAEKMLESTRDGGKR